MSENASTQSVLKVCEAALREIIDQAWTYSQLSEHLEIMPLLAEEISRQIILVGNESFEFLEQLPKERSQQVLEHCIINFLWADRAKSFLILWRDVFFEQYRAQVLKLDGRITIEDQETLNEASKATVMTAAQELMDYFEEEIRITRISRYGKERRIGNWMLQQNPWPVYREQIVAVHQQCQQLLDEFRDFESTSAIFIKIDALIGKTMDGCEEHIEKIKGNTQSTIRFIRESIAEDPPRPGKVVTHLESLEEELEVPEYRRSFNSQLEQEIQKFSEKRQVPVSTSLGWVQFKEIPFQKLVQRWLESEVLPILYEIWDLTALIKAEENTSLVNIRNRAVLLTNELKEGKTPDFKTLDLSQPLITFIQKIAKTAEELFKLKSMITGRIDKEFRISNLFNTSHDFLPVPIQVSFNQFMIDQDKLLGRTQNWFSKQVESIRKFRKRVELEDSFSIAERTVRYLQSRQVDPENSNYTSIFLTRGYVGESFWVGRENELSHIANLVKSWEEGFRGAVALTGQRLSGKSFMGEMVVNRLFPDRTIKLRPEEDLILPGRRVSTGFDLGEVLKYIRKYSLNTRPLIWIDDLELWTSATIPFSQNVKALQKFIDSHSTRMFFLVAMNNWTKAHLDQFHDSDRVFQAEINLDRMSGQEIEEAILIRHGATHKKLMESKGREVGPRKFRKMAKRVHVNADGNIGDALNGWASSIKKIDEEQVEFEFKSIYSLPNIQGADSLLLLFTVLMERQTSEYRLRKLFGPAFSTTYSTILQRLINIGLLKRESNGLLEVNRLAVNDLAKLLHRKKYLKLHHQKNNA